MRSSPGIYKRFDKYGQYDDDSEDAQTAGRLREVLSASRTPVLLLTATPMQNNLVELWGLVQYVDPLGTLLGDLPTFREVFCGVDDRQLAPGQEEELRTRLRRCSSARCAARRRTSSRSRSSDREARLFDYTMSAGREVALRRRDAIPARAGHPALSRGSTGSCCCSAFTGAWPRRHARLRRAWSAWRSGSAHARG